MAKRREARDAARPLARTVLWAGGACALALALAGGAPRGAAQAQTQDEGGTYRLADTWEDRPWTLTPGRYGNAADLSSAPDGSIFVLDNRTTAGRLAAVHVLAPDGRARRAWIVPEQASTDFAWQPVALDVGFDGTVYVLSQSGLQRTGVFGARVQRLRPDGIPISSFEVTLSYPRNYTDIAVRDDGRIYLTRTGSNPWCVYPPQGDPPPTSTPRPTAPPPDPAYSVDVFDEGGTRLAIIAPPEMAISTRLDVARDGRIYVIQRIPPTCDGSGGGGDPTPTPRPSFQEAPAALQPAPGDPINGVLVFDPDHSYAYTVPFSGGEDIAVGPAGVFVSRQGEIYGMEDGSPPGFEIEPMYSGPIGRTYAAFLGRTIYHLDVPANGRLQASMAHCYFQGLLRFDEPAARPASAALVGALDAPELEGPAFPLRVAAGEEIAVLLGRMRIEGSRTVAPGAMSYYASEYAWEPQTVQRWTPSGSPNADGRPSGGLLRSQLGLCAGSDSLWTRDVAIDGTTVYTVDPEFLEARPIDGPPAWDYWPGERLLDPDDYSFLTAVSADEGHAAVLDLGTQTVLVSDDEGRPVTYWPLDPDGSRDEAIVDLALHGDRVYLADLTGGRIMVRDRDDGALLDSWVTHDGAKAVAAGPGGDVFVLGRGGWAYHYRADGRLVASWGMPDPAPEPRDIAVDQAGKVYVNFTQLNPESNPSWDNQEKIERGGIWVFERVASPPSPPPAERACTARPDKKAAPRRIPLGDTVDVTLEVDGHCPGTAQPVQILFVFDTSRSMASADGLGLAKDAVLTMISRLDPVLSEIGLVTFAEGATLSAPLTRDLAQVRAKVAALRADGDTKLTSSLDVARLELTGERGDPGVRQLVVVVSDGEIKDDVVPLAQRDALLAAGAEIHALIFASWNLEAEQLDAFDALAGRANVLLDPSAGEAESLVDRLTGYRDEPGLFDAIAVVDEVPGNMTYIEGSARPPAAWDAAARTLTWTFGPVASSQRLEMTYVLRPQEVGTWPTNVQATADYDDVLGNPGQLVFPIPEVEVYADDLRVYLPWAIKSPYCVPKDRPRDVVLLLDASSSMREATPGDERSKIEAAREAAGQFLDALDLVRPDRPDGIDRASIVSFNAQASTHAGLTADAAALDRALADVSTVEGTRIDYGLEAATAALAERRSEALPVVVLLSDGLQNGSADPVRDASETLRRSVPEVEVFTIGLGTEIDEALLRDLATAADGYYESPSSEDLEAIYAAISERILCE